MSVCPCCNTQNRDTARFCARCAQPLRQSCPQCGADNPARSRFCNKCGSALPGPSPAREIICPQCGRNNPAGALFCNECGGVLWPTAPPPRPPTYPPTATDTGMLPPQSMLSGRYLITRRVGRGGMGAVYRAADARIPGKTWAVKEMSDAAITNPLEKQQARTSFRQEALMLARLDHRNLPKVTDHFSEGGRQYLVMDFIEGETLAERLEREGGGPLPLDEVLNWAEQLCDVLEYLHAQSPPVIFRDLKPGNVMVTPDGAVKLIDFGIARIFKPGKATDTAYFGTAGYAPKEQYGKGQTDARSDVYALGAMLHHLLTGADPANNPFQFESVRQLNKRAPAHVADCVMRALADDPDDRWQSITEMKAALAKGMASRPKPAPKKKPQPKVSPVAQPAAAAAAQAGGAAAAQPVSVPAGSRLNFWRGLGLVLMGAVIQTAGHRGTIILQVRYEIFAPALFTFVPALFGVLFGPWIGGLVGAVGWLGLPVLTGRIEPNWWGWTLSYFAVGALSGLMVKDARNWKKVFAAGIAASVAYVLSVTITIGIAAGWWRDWQGIAHWFLLPTLLPNLILLPLLARWLVGPVRRRGLYWQDYH